MRVCAEPGCPELIPAGARDGRCDEHRRAKDRLRDSSHARGYGRDHQAERARWAPIVATGHVKCARCRLPIAPAAPWDLGHVDEDRSKYAGPEHEACNRATSGRR